MAILRARDSFLVLVSISYKMPSCKVTSNHVCPLQQNVNISFLDIALYFQNKEI